MAFVHFGFTFCCAILFDKDELKEFLKIEARLRSVSEEMGQKWILGVSDVEKDWDSYIERLNSLR